MQTHEERRPQEIKDTKVMVGHGMLLLLLLLL